MLAVRVNVILVAAESIVLVAYTTSQSLAAADVDEVPVVVPALSTILAVIVPEPLSLLTNAANVTSLLLNTDTVPEYACVTVPLFAVTVAFIEKSPVLTVSLSAAKVTFVPVNSDTPPFSSVPFLSITLTSSSL